MLNPERPDSTELPDHISAMFDKLGQFETDLLADTLRNLFSETDLYSFTSRAYIQIDILPRLNHLISSGIMSDADLQVLLEWAGFTFEKSGEHWQFEPHATNKSSETYFKIKAIQTYRTQSSL